MTREEREKVIKLLETADDYCWEIADYNKPTILEGIEKAIDELKNYQELENKPTTMHTVRDLLEKLSGEYEITFNYTDYSFICTTRNTSDGVIPYLDCKIAEWCISKRLMEAIIIIFINKENE